MAEAEKDEKHALNCPKCSAGPALTEITGEGFAVDQCAGCGGIWFDFMELETALMAKHSGLTMRIPRPVNEELTQQKANCPACKTQMIKINSLSKPRVVMDGCKVCGGRWLDGGEFERLKGEGMMDRLKGLFGF